ARAVAVGDGRQTLYMGAEHFAQRLEFGLAQLRELLGHVRDRAVVLADLHAGAHLAGGGGETGAGEGFGEFLGFGLGALRGVLVDRGDSRHDRAGSLTREIGDGLLAADLAELADRRAGEVVVGVAELTASGGGELVLLGRPTAPLLLPRGRARGPGLTRFDQRVQMPAHPGGRQAEPVADGRRGDRPLL